MTGVAAHMPGLIRLTDPPIPGARVTLGGDFAGMLDPIAPSGEEHPIASAAAFNARGLLGSVRPISIAPLAPDPLTNDASNRTANQAMPAQTVSAPARPTPSELPMVIAPISSAPNEPIPSRDASRSVLRARAPVIAPLSPTANPTPIVGMARQAERAFPGEAMDRATTSLLPPAPAPASAVAPVSISLSMDAGRASVVARGDLSLAELETRLKQTLTQHDLELASLRLNGVDQPFASRRPVGGKYGNR